MKALELPAKASPTRTASSFFPRCRQVPYSVRVELTGFKALQNRGMELGAGQTVRQNFTLEVGALAETITVAGEAPLIERAASMQADSLGAQDIRELPVNRRNLANLMGLTAGVNVSGAGYVQMNGVAGGGMGLTVDGTEANAYPEARAVAQKDGENQISVMSLDSVAEVQIVKGVLPAEYGGVAGGQINVISRSGTNNFHGTAFYSGQNEKFNARNFFSTTTKPVGTFNQYGGTLGGPVLRNRAFFFATYEGYREKVERNLTLTVPYQAVRDEVLRALPFPETKIALDTLPLPTEPIVSAAGVVQMRRLAVTGVSAPADEPRITSWPRATFRYLMAPTSPSLSRGCVPTRTSRARTSTVPMIETCQTSRTA